ncbi:MAG: toll/interleukin-1 receptor domain-containing protein [Alphaproteobacteria bacterium]|nr:toll/interleukin-1 receptor domain-containing protein [Alphaproteobacteria bacterium]
MDGNARAGEARRLFLSYGRRDAADFAARLHRDLSDAGFQVFFDTQDIKGGQRWEAEIERSLDAAQALIAVLSPHAVRRGGDAAGADGLDSICLNEIARARETMKPIIPVMVEPCDVPLAINRQHYIDFIGWRQSADRYRSQLARLLADLSMLFDGGMPNAAIDRVAAAWNFAAIISEKTRHFHGRDWLFNEVDTWRETTREPVLLIVGDPGVGKSTFMAEMVRRDPGGRVLAWHFCQAETPATIEGGRFVRSIVGQLARRLPAYAALLQAPDVADCASGDQRRRPGQRPGGRVGRPPGGDRAARCRSLPADRRPRRGHRAGGAQSQHLRPAGTAARPPAAVAADRRHQSPRRRRAQPPGRATPAPHRRPG